uniref:Uncharacterized protein n=1 Tax=Megaviridae environmental sample TaxID=1737588 RepID=A0A5J6VJ92_9VIRU|nr:MAG: hypothetical protein [Megaviridae environmental sample]
MEVDWGMLFKVGLILSVAYGIFFIISSFFDRNMWKTDKKSTDEQKIARTTTRGTFCSIMMVFINIAIATHMKSLKIDNSLILTNFGFIFAAVVGYLLDICIGTDEGLSKSPIEMIKLGLSSLCNAAFLRYVITVFLDMFISTPIMDVMNGFFGGIFSKMEGSILNNFLHTNGIKILQNFVCFITFQAYTNDTRFMWAYPGETLDKASRIPSITIMLSTCISAVIYLTYRGSDAIDIKNIDGVGGNINTQTIGDGFLPTDKQSVRLFFTVLTIGVLTFSRQFNLLDAPREENENSTVSLTRTVIGLIIFCMFAWIGLVYPYSSIIKIGIPKSSN